MPNYLIRALLTLTASTARAQAERCHVDAPSDLDYFDGTTLWSGKPVVFRTRDSWFIVQDCASTSVTPVVGGHRLEKITPTLEQRLTAPPESAPAAAPIDVASPPSLPPTEPPMAPALGPEPVTPPPEERQPEPPLADTPVAPLPGGAPPGSATEPDKRTDLGFAGTAALLLGREALKADGGASSFSGDSPAHGVAFSLRWATLDPTLVGYASADAFGIAIDVEEENEASGSTQTSTSRLWRFDAKAGLLWAPLPSERSVAYPLRAAGGGLALVRLPYLAASDTSPPTARLDGVTSMGPWIGGTYEVMATDAVIAGVEASVGRLWGFETLSAHTIDVELTARFIFTEALSAAAAWSWGWVNATLPVDCFDAESCSEQETAKAMRRQLHLGLQAFWR